MLESFRKDAENKVPAISEIAHIAAILSHGHDIKDPRTLIFLANQSIALWETCVQQRERRIHVLSVHAREAVIKEEKRSLPRPKYFPTTVDIFLRYMMPNKRVKDRIKFHREYIRQMFRDRIPTEADIDECISREKDEKIGEGIFNLRADDFRRFLGVYESEIRRKRARAGAIALKEQRKQNG